MTIIKIAIVAFLLCIIQLNVVIIFSDAGPLLIILLGIFIALNVNPEQLPPALFLIGIFRDLFIGCRIGISSISLLFAGIIVLTLNQRTKDTSIATRLFIVGITLLLFRILEFVTTIIVTSHSLIMFDFYPIAMSLIYTLFATYPMFFFFERLNLINNQNPKGSIFNV